MEQGEFTPRIEQQKPKERMSDEQMGNLLSTIGNHEAKAITLLAISDKKDYSQSELYRKLINFQGDDIAWEISHTTPFSYCKYFSSIGGLAEKTIGQNQQAAFRITNYGENIGVPLAGLLLDFSERHNLSLLKLFGSTPSKFMLAQDENEAEFKKRSPYVRLKLFSELLMANSFPLRETDILKGLGKKGKDYLHHLQDLAENGLIEYKSIKANSPYTFWRISSPLPTRELPVFPGNKQIIHVILDILSSRPQQYLSSEEIYSFLPREIKERGKKESFIKTVSKALSFLKKRSLVEVKDFHASEYREQSEIELTQLQRETLMELMNILNSVKMHDPAILEKGRRLALEIIVDPKKISNLLRRAKESSNVANQTPLPQTQSLITQFVFSHPEGVDAKRIQDILRQRGIKLKVSRLEEIMRSFPHGSFKVTKKGSAKIYRPNP